MTQNDIATLLEHIATLDAEIENLRETIRVLRFTEDAARERMATRTAPEGYTGPTGNMGQPVASTTEMAMRAIWGRS